MPFVRLRDGQCEETKRLDLNILPQKKETRAVPFVGERAVCLLNWEDVFFLSHV